MMPCSRLYHTFTFFSFPYWLPSLIPTKMDLNLRDFKSIVISITPLIPTSLPSLLSYSSSNWSKVNSVSTFCFINSININLHFILFRSPCLSFTYYFRQMTLIIPLFIIHNYYNSKNLLVIIQGNRLVLLRISVCYHSIFAFTIIKESFRYSNCYQHLLSLKISVYYHSGLM